MVVQYQPRHTMMTHIWIEPVGTTSNQVEPVLTSLTTGLNQFNYMTQNDDSYLGYVYTQSDDVIGLRLFCYDCSI